MDLTSSIYLIVILTSLWVAIDSHRLQISASKKPYSTANGLISWLFCCLLLWIVAFPVYLFKRAKTLRERSLPSSTLATTLGAAAILAVVLAIAAPFLGWQRLSADELSKQVGQSIESTWKKNPATQALHVKSLKLTRKQGDDYSGVVVADNSGREESYNVSVNYDGKMMRWQTTEQKP